MKKLSIALSLFVLLTGCSSTNPYMTAGTEEYQSVTQQIIGEWRISYFEDNKKNVIGTKFADSKLDLDPETRVATFTFHLSRSTINSKLADWRAAFPGITVDSYAIIATAGWRVDSKGETVFFDPLDSEIDIKGSGNNFESFFGSETMKFEASKAAGDRDRYGGGIGGLLQQQALGAATAKATGTEDYFIQVKMGVGYWILDLTQKSYTLDSRTGGLIKVTR